MVQERSYIIASTPRTGSYLLCEGLEATGIAGHPTEVFCPDNQHIWLKRWSLSQDCGFANYLQAAIRHGTTDNGVYGLKIHSVHVAELARQASCGSDEVLESLFPGAMFVNIVRLDRRAQALSYFRALATKEWWRIEGVDNDQKTGREELTHGLDYLTGIEGVDNDQKTGSVPTFDLEKVRALEIELEHQQLAWEQYFRKRRIEPLIVEYEALTKDYREPVARVLAFLHLDVSAAQLIPPPRLVRQSDGLTLRWRRLMETTSSHGAQIDEVAW